MVKRDEEGRIVGGRLSPETQFEEGEHWREEKPYWNEEWLRREYARKQRSAGEIAEEFGCTEGNIRHFLRKHDIERRSVSEARAVKQWGAEGEENGMYGATGEANPNWKGGVTPERQAFPEYVAMAQKRVGVTVDEPERLVDDDQQATLPVADGGG